MPLLAFPAVFMRGGTSRAIMFHQKDLPDRATWDPIFLAAMGSPDPNGRQLNGMGGGISSLSKICILAPSAREDADIDYTFAQIQIREAAVDYRGNCGNMSSAVGPFSFILAPLYARLSPPSTPLCAWMFASVVASSHPRHGALSARASSSRPNLTFYIRYSANKCVKRPVIPQNVGA